MTEEEEMQWSTLCRHSQPDAVQMVSVKRNFDKVWCQTARLTARRTRFFFLSSHSGFLPLPKHTHVQPSTKSKWSVGVNVSVDGCLSLGVGPTLEWWLVQDALRQHGLAISLAVIGVAKMYQLVARLVRRLPTDDIAIQNAGQTVTGNKLMQTWTHGSDLFTISVPTSYFLMLHLWPFGMFPHSLSSSCDCLYLLPLLHYLVRFTLASKRSYTRV